MWYHEIIAPETKHEVCPKLLKRELLILRNNIFYMGCLMEGVQSVVKPLNSHLCINKHNSINEYSEESPKDRAKSFSAFNSEVHSVAKSIKLRERIFKLLNSSGGHSN